MAIVTVLAVQRAALFRQLDVRQQKSGFSKAGTR
jgi:hypothetical protein